MAKRYLDVNYDDRELAKRLGAKWDPSVRRWYCPAGSPLAKLFKWRAEARISEANATLKGAAQKAAAQAADHTGTLKLQKPRTHSDIQNYSWPHNLIVIAAMLNFGIERLYRSYEISTSLIPAA